MREKAICESKSCLRRSEAKPKQRLADEMRRRRVERFANCKLRYEREKEG